jgi:hypothetical protein
MEFENVNMNTFVQPTDTPCSSQRFSDIHSRMKRKMPIKELISWRYKLAKSEAPSRPSATRLLDLALPWWEKNPEEFRSLAAQLNQIELAEDRPVAKSRRGRGQPIAALAVFRGKKFQNSVRVQQFRLRNAKLNLSFEMETAMPAMGPTLEVTFISDHSAQPLFCALATASANGTYRINTELPSNLIPDWGRLKPADRMPFRLLLRFPGR